MAQQQPQPSLHPQPQPLLHPQPLQPQPQPQELPPQPATAAAAQDDDDQDDPQAAAAAPAIVTTTHKHSPHIRLRNRERFALFPSRPILCLPQEGGSWGQRHFKLFSEIRLELSQCQSTKRESPLTREAQAPVRAAVPVARSQGGQPPGRSAVAAAAWGAGRAAVRGAGHRRVRPPWPAWAGSGRGTCWPSTRRSTPPSSPCRRTSSPIPR